MYQPVVLMTSKDACPTFAIDAGLLYPVLVTLAKKTCIHDVHPCSIAECTAHEAVPSILTEDL